MNLLAIIGSPRKGKATDTLVDKAIEGVKSKSPNCNVNKLHLIDHAIQFCKNCLRWSIWGRKFIEELFNMVKSFFGYSVNGSIGSAK